MKKTIKIIKSKGWLEVTLDFFLKPKNKNEFIIFLFLLFFTFNFRMSLYSMENSKEPTNIYPSKIVDSIKKENEENISEKQLVEPINEKMPQPDFVRGIYLTAYTTASPKFHEILDKADSAGINTIIFDLKNMNGDVFFRAHQNELLTNDNMKPIIDIEKIVKTLHKRNMRAVSRVVMFHDSYNAERDSALRAINPDGTRWVENRKRGPSWLDSSHPQVQEYLLELIEQIAQTGVDEIQMDYIRFPTQGYSHRALFNFQQEDIEYAQYDSLYSGRDRDEIILDFVKKVEAICKKNDVTLSADVFAIIAWQREADIKSTGQDINKLTPYLDNIHPMIYSSHFAENFGYRQNVYNEAYRLIYQGTKLTMKKSESNCRVIPYIQANSWKVNFKKEYIQSQIQAIEDLNASGYILWNSSNRYEKTLTWLKEIAKPD